MAVNYTFTGEFTLKELMEFKTVPELKDILLTLGLGLRGNPLKADYVEHVVRVMTEEPQKLVERMFYYELKACLDVIEGKMSLEHAEQSGLLFELNRFGLIYSTIQHNINKKFLCFSKEMAQLLRPLIPAELERREKDGSLLAEKLALGCANLYGFTEMHYVEELIPELEQAVGHELSEKDLSRMFRPVLYAMHYGIKRKDRPFMSPFCVYNGFKFDTAHIDFGIEAKTFDFDTIVGFGEMPYPVIKSPATEKLKKVAEKHGDPEVGTPEYIVRQLWIEKQDESRASAIPAFNDYFLFASFEDLQASMRVIMEFFNTVPYWRLRGNSSEEIGRKGMEEMRKSGKMPHISIGPNMRAMGIESLEQLQEMARRGEDLPFPSHNQPNQSGPKVGRNDPCPCGSGKKYKHCCGK
ncbi:MAG: SEC-C domain-containing protein [Bacteroidales bacterium]|nr:SEC-C domain-containing protein [Bacteroidales bacterium]